MTGQQIAVTVSARGPTAGRITQLWRAVAAFEDAPSMDQTGYPPHLTFAIYEHEADAAISPFDAVFDQVDWVAFPPPRVLGHSNLGPFETQKE